MDESPKKPHGIGWYAAWATLALVLYVASYGPFLCLSVLTNERPLWLWETLWPVYRPLTALRETAPQPFDDLMYSYGDWWMQAAS